MLAFVKEQNAQRAPLKEIAFQGGNLCFNYDAEAYAIKAAI